MKLTNFLKRHLKGEKRPASIDWWFLVGAVLLYGLLTIPMISAASIWFDEAFSAYIIRFDFASIAIYTANDVHPPLYYWLLKAWSMLFGTSELALRSLSVVFGAIAIGFAYLLTLKWFGRRAAVAALGLMVVSPVLVKFGMEMRMYTLAAAIVMAATYVLTIAERSTKIRPWIIYGVLIGLGMWTHYFTALAWIAHWVWRALSLRLENKKGKRFASEFFSKQWIIAYTVAVVTFLPWLPWLISQLVIVQTNGFWILPVNANTLTNYATNSIYYQNADMVTSWLAVAFFVLITISIVGSIKLYNSLDLAGRKRYLLIACLAFLPPLLLLVASLPPLRPSFVERYLVPATLATMLFLGITLALAFPKLRQWKRFSIGVGIIVLLGCGVGNVYYYGSFNKNIGSANTTRQALEMLRLQAAPGQPIIADSPWLYYEAVYYEQPDSRVYFIDPKTYRYGSLEMLKRNDMNKIKDITAFGREHSEVWYLGRPAENELTPPVASWQKIREVRLSDPITGKPLYAAGLFRTSAE